VDVVRIKPSGTGKPDWYMRTRFKPFPPHEARLEFGVLKKRTLSTIVMSIFGFNKISESLKASLSGIHLEGELTTVIPKEPKVS